MENQLRFYGYDDGVQKETPIDVTETENGLLLYSDGECV
jgi:hypothetical protein